MINRDKFEALEGVWADQNLLTHLSLALIVFGVSLGVEMGVAAYKTKDDVALATLIVCIGAIVLGAILGFFGWRKKRKYNSLRSSLFDDQQLVSDETTLISSDGTEIKIDNLSRG